MPSASLSPELRKTMEEQAVFELTGSAIYTAIARREKNPENRKVLELIAADEREHYRIWSRHLGREYKPRRLLVFFYSFVALVFGYTFAIRLLERTEGAGIQSLEKIAEIIPELPAILEKEEEHEEALIDMLDEERLRYVGDIVLGLNDALVELTGALSGLVFATRNNSLVALSGIITGVAATLSMAASNFLARRAEGKSDALKSSVYTGIAYLLTVVALVLPYLLLPNHLFALAFGIMIAVVLLIILLFNYYLAVAKNLPFWKRFAEMAAISLGVALLSYVIGIVAKSLLGLDI